MPRLYGGAREGWRSFMSEVTLHGQPEGDRARILARPWWVQGYLAHKKTPGLRILSESYL